MERQWHAVDGRAISFTLTHAGRAEAERQRQLPDEFAEAMASLAPEDVAAMLGGLSGMIGSLQDRKAIPVARMCLTCGFFRSPPRSLWGEQAAPLRVRGQRFW